MKIAAIYARVSSDRQREAQTIASQTAAMVEYAQAHDYTVPAEWIFQDEGYSGSVLARPGLERVRDLAAEGQLQAVLIHSPDRLSRKYAYQVLLTEEFARQGVEVRFLHSPSAATPEDHLLLQFQGMIAEYERAQIAERTRRGKRHRAKDGQINVLSGAPYGYRYVKKTDTCTAFYEVIEAEAAVARRVYHLYTVDGWSIGTIMRWLNAQGIPTRHGKSPWERSTVWAMLRNPAYQGTACFGKTERAERQRVTRPLRRRGGFTARCSTSRDRPREDWIEIPVPALVSIETFALAQERLQANRHFASRHTKEPTLLQGLLVCQECGYAYYRTSTRTSTRKLYYYRCLGSDDWRYQNGRVCAHRPVRQDYLDEVVWRQVIDLLTHPDLVRDEIDRRMQAMQESNPTQIRKEVLMREHTHICKGMDRLLDAYQEGLLLLEELRERMPELQKRETAVNAELQTLEAGLVDQERCWQLGANLEGFLGRLQQGAQSLNVKDRQRIVRSVVKEVLVGSDMITIKHSIPVSQSSGASEVSSYVLRGRSGIAIAGEHLPTLRTRRVVHGVETDRGRGRNDGPLRGRFRGWIPALGRCRAFSDGAYEPDGSVWAGIASWEDPDHGVWAVCGAKPRGTGPGEARDIRLSGVHALLREDHEREVCGQAEDGGEANGREAGGGGQGAQGAETPAHG